MGAVIAYWRLNYGSAWALKWYEEKMLSQADDIHVQDVVELCETFRWNRTHHRDHLKDMITNTFKPVMLKKWKDEVDHNQRTLFNLMKELENLDYWDKDIWSQIISTIGHKKRINNITFFQYFNDTLRKLNTDPQGPFFQQLDESISKLKERHYTPDRKWRYDFEGQHLYTLEEMIAKREDSRIDDLYTGKGSLDQTLIQRAIEAERKMKRLRMAKYSVELFDEIVTEMMKEKRTMMEMMAELDVDDEKILESQQRITNRRLISGLKVDN